MSDQPKLTKDALAEAAEHLQEKMQESNGNLDDALFIHERKLALFNRSVDVFNALLKTKMYPHGGSLQSIANLSMSIATQMLKSCEERTHRDKTS